MLNETIKGTIPVRVGKTKQFKTTINDMFENFYKKRPVKNTKSSALCMKQYIC